MPRQLLSACLPPWHSLNNDQRLNVWAEPQATSRAGDVLSHPEAGTAAYSRRNSLIGSFCYDQTQFKQTHIRHPLKSPLKSGQGGVVDAEPAGPVDLCTGSWKQPSRLPHAVVIFPKKKRKMFWCISLVFSAVLNHETKARLWFTRTKHQRDRLSQDAKIVVSSLSKQQFSTDVVKKLNKGLSPRVCLHHLFWATVCTQSGRSLFYLSCLYVAANGPFPPRQPAAQTLTHPV